MMRIILSYVSLLLLGVSTAKADLIASLDFNNLQIDEEVLGYYNGHRTGAEPRHHVHQ